MTKTEKERAIALYERIESDLETAGQTGEVRKRGFGRRAADKLLGFVIGRISDADPQKATLHVRKLREKFPDAAAERIVEMLIKAKCQKAGTVGAATSAANIIPGIGTALSLTVGMAVDIGTTLKQQAELVLEIAEARGVVLSDARRNEVLLVVVGIGAGTYHAGGKALQGLTQKVGEMAMQKWMAKAVPAMGVVAAAGTNVLSTYIIGKRADAYFQRGPEAMGDWKDNLRAISGVDERKLAGWVSESSGAVVQATSRTGQAIVSSGKKGAATVAGAAVGVGKTVTAAVSSGTSKVLQVGKAGTEAVAETTGKAARAIGSAGDKSFEAAKKTKEAVAEASRKSASVITGKVSKAVGLFSKKEEERGS